RGDVDDPAAAGARHGLYDGAAHQERAIEIDADDAVPFLDRKGVDVDTAGDRVDAGIVDENVDAAERGERVGDAAADGCLIADVHRHRDCARQLGGGLHRTLPVDIGDDDGCPVLGEALHNRPSDPGGGPGDEGDPAGKISPHDQVLLAPMRLRRMY